jgi:hypothetical protein
MVNLRGREITVEGRSKSWVPVVVLDHPGAADYVPTSVAVVVLRRDWEFLFQQLKSTDAVVRYLHRVKDMSPVALGDEAMRYDDLASADAEAAPRVFDPRLVPKGARHISTPLLPREPAGHTDQRYHAVIRAILEDIAVAPLAENIEESEVLDVLAAIDTMPVGHRVELGKTLLEWLVDVSSIKEGSTRWRFRNLRSADQPTLIFAATTRLDDAALSYFSAYVTLRHQQLLDAVPEIGDRLTVGVLLTPLSNAAEQSWDTTMVATRGDQGFGADFRAKLEGIFGQPGDLIAAMDE